MIIFYSILSAIDYIVYNLAAAMFRVIIEIANVQFFSDQQITAVSNRIYIVVGVLMLFKLVISAIQYMINPDSFDDKEKGVSGILKKTVISIALIVLVPAVFRFLISVQKPIIETIPRIIFGSDTEEKLSNDDVGEKISYSVLSSFVKVRDGHESKIKSDERITDIGSFATNIQAGCPPISLFGLFGSYDDCHYDYMIIISTICGGFLCYVLLSMILDVAIRTIKFGIIQILAPIPISSYVFSKDKLNKFAKTAMNVYIDLFIRMIIVYFIIFAIENITNTDAVSNLLAIGDSSVKTVGDWFRKVIANVGIIFGLLMFAKNAPKFISELLGLPDVTSGDMADMFKPAWQRIGGFSAAGAAIGAYRNSKEYGEDVAKGHKYNTIALRRAMSAGAHATGTRLRDIASGKSLAESYKTSKDAANARTSRNLEYANRFPDAKERRRVRRQEMWDKYTGVTTGGKRASAQIEAANRALKARSNAWNRAQSKVVENASAYNGGTIVDSQGNTLSYADMYALFEREAPEMYAGQKRELASRYQKMKDEASTDFLRMSFAGVATGSGDGQSRNVFAEDVFSIARSGADKETVGKLLFKDVVVSSGATVHVDAIDAAERINKMNQLRDAGVPLTDPRWTGLQFTADEAEALAMFARDLNKTAGTVRLEATKTQTSEPKSS